ncbi:hypothetical protein, partial [Klebsiella pneumoniae]|uniref:hypothetical protein n=1 Tax=Klebsiella pneumoniae TaxID=573 RepID=UPI0025A00BC4
RHVLPGCVFIVWGSWWAYNVITYHLWRSAARPYRGRAWYPLGVRALWLLEPALKVAVPLVALFMELYWDHAPPAFRHLYCPPGTKFAGRFDMAHTNNW